jgi:GT2 family glycosyltransferase
METPQLRPAKWPDWVVKPAPDLSVILVCWNNKVYLEPCLRSLYEGDLRSTFEVIVVDNGSTDGSQAMLREQFPAVRLIQNDHNVGLARACNQGIEVAQGRYPLLLNNDTLVNAPSLDAMVDFMDHHADAGAVGGRLVNPDGSFQAGYANFSTLWEELLIASQLGERFWPGYPSHLDAHQVKAVGWISSACLILRREALDEVGLLDEEYFIYGDEADLQYDLHQAGWQVYYLPHVTTVHYGGRSMNRWGRRKMVYRGKLLFYKKNYGALRTALLRTLFGSLTLAKIASWGVAQAIPTWRARAQKELRSNLEVMQLCWKMA